MLIACILCCRHPTGTQILAVIMSFPILTSTTATCFSLTLTSAHSAPFHNIPNPALHCRPNRTPERPDLRLVHIPGATLRICIPPQKFPHFLLALRLDQHHAARHVQDLTLSRLLRQRGAAEDDGARVDVWL